MPLLIIIEAECVIDALQIFFYYHKDMKRKNYFLPFIAILIILTGCSTTPESQALKKVRDGIQLLIQNGFPTEKATYLLEEASKQIKDPFLEETVALFYIAQQSPPQWDKAIPHLEKSRTGFASIVRAEAEMEKKNWNEAMKYLEKRKDPLSLLLSAYCLLKIGKTAEAKQKLAEVSISKEKIPQPLIFNAMVKSQPLPCVNLRYYSLKWVWDNLEEIGREIGERLGEKDALRLVYRQLADYANVEPEFTASLSLLSYAVNEKERRVLEKAKEDFSREAGRLEGETIGGLYRLIRLLGVIAIGGVILVFAGIIMSMAGLVKGREHPLWKRGFAVAGSGFALWIILLLLFHPLPAGGMVQGYIGRKFYRKQVELIKTHKTKLDNELRSIQGR